MILLFISTILFLLIITHKVYVSFKKDISEPVKTIAKLIEEGDRFKVYVIEHTLCVFRAIIIDTETNYKTSVYYTDLHESSLYYMTGDLSWMNKDECEYIIEKLRDKILEEEKKKDIEEKLTKKYDDLNRREEAIIRYMRKN